MNTRSKNITRLSSRRSIVGSVAVRDQKDKLSSPTGQEMKHLTLITMPYMSVIDPAGKYRNLRLTRESNNKEPTVKWEHCPNKSRTALSLSYSQKVNRIDLPHNAIWPGLNLCFSHGTDLSFVLRNVAS